MSIYGSVCPVVRIHGSRIHGVEMRMVSLTIIHIDPLAKLLLPDPITLCSVSLEVLVSEGKVGVSSRGHNKYYIELKVETSA